MVGYDRQTVADRLLPYNQYYYEYNTEHMKYSGDPSHGRRQTRRTDSDVALIHETVEEYLWAYNYVVSDT